MNVRSFILIFTFTYLLISFFAPLSSAENELMTVEANIFAPVVKIQIPDYVFLGNLTKGFSTDRIRVDINNTGTTAVRVTPQLADDKDTLFSNLYFTRRTTEPYQQIGVFSIDLDQPSDVGKVEQDYFYMKLDLKGYTEDIRNDLIGKKSSVIFWALPR